MLFLVKVSHRHKDDLVRVRKILCSWLQISSFVTTNLSVNRPNSSFFSLLAFIMQYKHQSRHMTEHSPNFSLKKWFRWCKMSWEELNLPIFVGWSDLEQWSLSATCLALLSQHHLPHLLLITEAHRFTHMWSIWTMTYITEALIWYTHNYLSEWWFCRNI